MSYFTIQHSYCLLLLTLGLTATIGQGISYNSVLIAAQHWIPHRIGLASGLIVGGFGGSAFIFSPIQTMFINPDNYSADKNGFFTQEDLLSRVPQVFLLLATIYATFQTLGLLFLAQAVPEADANGEAEPLLSCRSDPSVQKVISSSTFILLYFTMVFTGLWGQVASGLYKAFGQQFIFDDFFLASVSSFASIFNCGSRIISGQIVDKTSYQVSMAVVCALGSALMWSFGLMQMFNSKELFMLWVCLMFSCIGATYTIFPYVTHKCFGSSHFGVIYGILQTSLSLSGSGAALLTTYILPHSGFQTLFLVVGLMLAMSLLFTMLIQLTTFGRPSRPHPPT